jgi:hypothetical protein
MERLYIMFLFLVLSLLFSEAVCFPDESTRLSQAVRYKLARVARTFLGLPYRWGGNVGASGSGLLGFNQNDFC